MLNSAYLCNVQYMPHNVIDARFPGAIKLWWIIIYTDYASLL